MTSRRLGLDIGGTKIAVGIVALSGRGAQSGAETDGCRVLSRRLLPTREAGDGERLLERVAGLAEEACRAIDIRPVDLDGAGVALPGPVDPIGQRLLAAASLPGLVGHPVARYFQERWQAGVSGWAVADNDANAAALAESRYGAGKGGRVVCYLTISTGIGGGVVVDGRVFRGATGQAGEIGHLKLRTEGPPCSCGDRGCLEALASGPAIGRRAREAALASRGRLHDLVMSDPEALTAEKVAVAARAGDPVARAVWDEAMADLGAGIATLVNLFNPDVVVIGGGVSRSADIVLPAVRRVVADRAMSMLARATRIEVAALGDDVGVVGAALLLDDPPK